MFYDECAHGWLDGLNRLFMEADDRCYKLHTAARFMPLFSSKNFWELEKISSASQKRKIGTHLEKIKAIVQFSPNP